MHRPSSSLRPSAPPRSRPRKSSKPSWNDSQHDAEEYRSSAQQLIEKKLRLMSKEQLCKIAGIPTPQPPQRRPVNTDAHSHQPPQADKENITRPTLQAQQKEQLKPVRLAAAAAAAGPASAPPPLGPHVSQPNVPASSRSEQRGRVVVLPVTTPSPSPPASAMTAGPPAASSLSFKPWSRNALLSPVLERSLEMGDDDEEEEEESNNRTQPPPPSPSGSPLSLTPDKRAQRVLEEVRERLKQLSGEPAPAASAAAVAEDEPAGTAATSDSPQQRRLHAALRQVAAHVDELTIRRAEEEAERCSLRQQLTAAHERIRLLETVSTQHRSPRITALHCPSLSPLTPPLCCCQSVSLLESSQSELQGSLLRLQSSSEQQLASVIHSLTRLERRSAEPPPRSPNSRAPAAPAAAAAAAAAAAPSFPLPPPFVSSQLAASPPSPPTPRQHPAIPSASSGSAPLTANRRAAAEEEEAALSSPSPARSGRSPRRIVLRYEEVSRVEQSVIEMEADDGQEDDGGDEQQSEQQRSLLETPTPAAPPADAQPAARRRAGWPRSSAGWTVQLR